MRKFEGQQKRNGDEVCEQQQPSTGCLHKEQEPILFPRALVLLLDILNLLGVVPNCSVGSCDDTETQLNDEDHDDELVGAHFNV